jgi:hypothetical protein
MLKHLSSLCCAGHTLLFTDMPIQYILPGDASIAASTTTTSSTHTRSSNTTLNCMHATPEQVCNNGLSVQCVPCCALYNTMISYYMN